MEERKTINKSLQTRESSKQNLCDNITLTSSYSQSSFLFGDSNDEINLERDLNMINRIYKDDKIDFKKQTVNNNTEEKNNTTKTKQNIDINNKSVKSKKHHIPHMNIKTGRVYCKNIIFERYLSKKQENFTKQNKGPALPFYI